MNFKKKIFYSVLVLLSIIIMMPLAEAQTKAYYKRNNGTCTLYPELPGFCVQPGVSYNRNANYHSCDLNLTCYDAAAAWYGKQHESTNAFWAAQTILNGRTFYTGPSCSNATEIPTESAKQYATDYCILPSFDGTEYNIKVGQTMSIPDNNGVLSEYEVYSASPAIKITKNGNQLVIEGLYAYTGAEILIHKGSKSAVVGSCSSTSQNLVKVNAAPYVYRKLYVNVTEEEQTSVVKLGALKILKTDEFGQPLENVRFKIGKNLNGVENTDYVIRKTNSEGIITYNSIVVGSSFYYQELPPENGTDYTVSDSRVKYIYIGEEKTYEVKVTNFNQNKGAIKVIKTDELGNPLVGAEFMVGTNLEGRLNYDYYIMTTNKYGEIMLSDIDLDFGESGEIKYYVKETSGVEGYVFNSEEAYTYTLVLNEEQNYDEITIKNRKDIQTKLTIIKKSKEDEKPLPNVKFGIYNEDGSLYDTRITNDQGTITIDNIEFGKYFIEELEAPTGYQRLSERREFEITEEQPIVIETITNEIINSKTGEVNLTLGFIVVLVIAGCTYLVLKKKQKLI